MTAATAGFRLALRLAWRNARRHRVATFLTALLVAVPVVALVAAAVLVRSAQIPTSEQDRRSIGAADVLVSQTNPGPPVAPPLPTGSRVVSDAVTSAVLTGTLRGSVDHQALSYDNPLTAGIIRQRSGHAPRAADEIVATTYLANRLHLHLGQRLQLRGVPGTLTLVGTVVDASDVRAASC